MKYSPKRKVKGCRRKKYWDMKLLDSEGRIVRQPLIPKKRVTHKWLLEYMKQTLAKYPQAVAAVVKLDYVWFSTLDDRRVCSELVYVGSYGDTTALQKRGVDPLEELKFMALANGV